MQFIKCEKSGLKGYILDDSIRMTFWKIKNVETEDKHGFQGFGRGVVNYKGMHRRFIRVMEFFPEVLM